MKDKEDSLELALNDIEKQFGKGSVIRMGDGPIEGIRAISTGCLSLDIALGVGGLPRGRVVEIYGPEAAGKSSLAIHVVAEAQKLGEKCLYIDAEHSFNEVYAREIGVDIDDLYLSQPQTTEQALEIADRMIRSGDIAVVVIDSVASMVPRAELEGDFGDSHVGLSARLMSQALRKMTGVISKTDTLVIFINQIREKIGVMYGSPETTPGGRALKFYSSVRLDVRRVEAIKQGVEVVGAKTKVTVQKNKVSPPFKKTEFDIIYGKGISNEGVVLDLAAEMGFVKKSGAWYSYGETQIGQGRDSSKQYLTNNPGVMKELTELILEKVKGNKDV
jgi:recombination protein RecA